METPTSQTQTHTSEMNTDQQLAVTEQQVAIQTGPFSMNSWENVNTLAENIAASGIYKIKTKAKAVTLLLLAHEQHTTLSEIMKRTHVSDDGMLIGKSDYIQGRFEDKNWILFHIRADDMVAASFGRGLNPSDEVIERANKRFLVQWKLLYEKDPVKRGELIEQLSALQRPREITIIRTLDDAIEKGIAVSSDPEVLKANWKTSPRQMLTARCATEGVRVVDPSCTDGAHTEEEMSDVRSMEVAGQSPKERLQAQIDELVAKADMTGSREEKARLLGKAAALRTELHEKYPPAGSTAKEAPKLTNLTGDPVAEVPATAPAAPRKVVEATVDQIVPPGGSTHPDDALPGLDPVPAKTVDAEPDYTKWEDYPIAHVETYKGKKLGTMAVGVLKVLHERRGTPYLESDDDNLKIEAKFIEAAWKASQPKKPGGKKP